MYCCVLLCTPPVTLPLSSYYVVRCGSQIYISPFIALFIVSSVAALCTTRPIMQMSQQRQPPFCFLQIGDVVSTDYILHSGKTLKDGGGNQSFSYEGKRSLNNFPKPQTVGSNEEVGYNHGAAFSLYPLWTRCRMFKTLHESSSSFPTQLKSFHAARIKRAHRQTSPPAEQQQMHKTAPYLQRRTGLYTRIYREVNPSNNSCMS